MIIQLSQRIDYDYARSRERTKGVKTNGGSASSQTVKKAAKGKKTVGGPFVSNADAWMDYLIDAVFSFVMHILGHP